MTVTRGLANIFCISVIKLSKNLPCRFANNVSQYIQAATVGHAKDDFIYALCACFFNR